MDGKSSRPETRSQTTKAPMSEAELEIIYQRQTSRQEKLNTETQVLRAERERFMKQKEKALRDIENKRGILQQREIDIQRWDEANTKDETTTLQEVEILRQEIKILRKTMIGQQTSTPLGRFEPDPFGDRDNTPRKVTFQEALETVPIYDGTNLTLSQFIRACRRARDVIPASSEQNLTRLLINKLRGRALSAVEDEPCDSIAELIDLLTIAFGTQKTINQYKGELSTIHLKPNEHILDYISRVKDL